MQRLQQWKLPVICFLDEPCLALLTQDPFRQGASGAIQVLRTVIAMLQAAGILVGLHCCADQASFQIMCQVAPDILSFDAYQNLELFGRDQDARTFLKEGGVVAFGLIPTVSDPSKINATTLFTRWLLASQDMSDISRVASQTMITATCGLGLLHSTQAESIFHTARQIAWLVKKAIRG